MFSLLRKKSLIQPQEKSLFLLLILVLTSITLNNKLLKILKEALIITAPDSGAHIIPFLKIWILIPVSLALIAIFRWLCTKYNLYKVFQIMTGAFLIYFALFLFVIYPFRDSLHPHQFCQWLEGKIPASFCNFIAGFVHEETDIEEV